MASNLILSKSIIVAVAVPCAASFRVDAFRPAKRGLGWLIRTHRIAADGTAEADPCSITMHDTRTAGLAWASAEAEEIARRDHAAAVASAGPAEAPAPVAAPAPIPCDAPAAVIARVDVFAEMEGRTWRAKLRELWQSGRDTGLLREARNYIGPSGLDDFKPGRMVPSNPLEPDAAPMVPQPVQPAQANAGACPEPEDESAYERAARRAGWTWGGPGCLWTIADGRDSGFTAETAREACEIDRLQPRPIPPAAVRRLADHGEHVRAFRALPVLNPAAETHRAVMLALDAFEAAPWPRPLIEINPRPVPALDVLPPAPRYPFAPVLDLPAPAPRPMADVLQSLAVEFGPAAMMRRPALALRPEPRAALDFLTMAEAVALYVAAVCFGLALALSAF